MKIKPRRKPDLIRRRVAAAADERALFLASVQAPINVPPPPDIEPVEPVQPTTPPPDISVLTMVIVSVLAVGAAIGAYLLWG